LLVYPAICDLMVKDVAVRVVFHKNIPCVLAGATCKGRVGRWREEGCYRVSTQESPFAPIEFLGIQERFHGPGTVSSKRSAWANLMLPPTAYRQAMRYVILPQAIRIVLPPLGNDFIAMLKDTSLASALAVGEITHLSRQHRNRTFTTFQPLNVAAFLYLAMTLLLTRGVRYLERRMSPDE